MVENNISNLVDMVRKIENLEILLPDFQREFVWKSEEQQKSIVASVLARMPIGSILLLESRPDEYSSKLIGLKDKKVDISKIDSKVEFLLDGQQRITVLTNVFSNIIHNQCEKVSDLTSPSLKRRFFLRIPKWSASENERDLFGVKKLKFPYDNLDMEDPDFLTGEIEPFIECFHFLADDKKPYNPKEKLDTKLDDFCLAYEKGYLIPLYLLIPGDKGNKDAVYLRYEEILDGIAEKIVDEILIEFTELQTEENKNSFIEKMFDDDEIINEVKADKSLIKNELIKLKKVWKRALNNYLEACIRKAYLNQFIVKEDKRARAIDIYENLNQGGTSLSTFDLVMARAAKVSRKSLFERIVSYMEMEKSYTKHVLPDQLENIIADKIEARKYNATLSLGCYNEAKNEISPKYIDAFLDVLSLYSYNEEFEVERFELENIKRNKILSLEPEKIDQNCEIVCIALDRAMFFFQTRCGIRNIQEINYSLMLVLVATLFIKEEYFESKKIHKKLEAWYWASVFSGEYDKDQNTIMIKNLKTFVKMLQGKVDASWLVSIKNNVLYTNNFSDKELLLMQKVEEDRYPKQILKAFVCQYLLSKTYTDMFDGEKMISVFCDEAEDLQAHHIIPLGTVAKIGQSTSELRKDPKHICNSPLNFVYITKESNRAISDDSLEVYISKICDEAKSVLYVNTINYDVTQKEKTKIVLENRYDQLKSDIKNHIQQLLV